MTQQQLHPEPSAVLRPVGPESLAEYVAGRAGLYPGIVFSDYLKLDALNISSLAEIADSPRSFRYWRDNPKPVTDAMLIGRAAHTMTLEPHRMQVEYALWTGGARRGSAWEEFRFGAEAQGKTVLTEGQFDDVKQIAAAIQSDPITSRYCRPGEAAELSIVATDPDTGTLLRGRADYHRDGILLDIKTTRCTNEHEFFNDSSRRMYHARLAWYAWLLELNGAAPHTVKILAAQNVPPFDVWVCNVGSNDLAAGRVTCCEWLEEYASCVRSGQWPGLARGKELTLEVRDWALPDADVELTLDGVKL